METWRSRAKPVIMEVIRKVGLSDEKRLRKALKEAYPFGERRKIPIQGLA